MPGLHRAHLYGLNCGVCGSVLAFVLGACAPSTNTQTDVLRHSEVVQPIWNARCLDACHVKGGSIEIVPLDADNALEALLGPSSQSELPLVTAGDPERSYLMHKLRNTYFDEPASGYGYAMPWGEELLEVEDLATIEAWILDGALP